MKQLVIGILAHVDAGKTTLSEAMLYAGGTIRKMGRVDNRDAFLDTFELERARGITIFSKQAVFNFQGTRITLLDTPGHVDFSAEMERTLQVLDYAILVISGADGVQGHTLTLWRLLSKYNIPVFLFINKMDQNGTDREKLLAKLRRSLSEACTDFTDRNDSFYETIAMSDENVLNHFLDKGVVGRDEIKLLIKERKVFPCFFGSALKSEGVKEFLRGMEDYTFAPSYPEEFGARVFKIARDEQGNRLTYMKVTGGSLRVKTVVSDEKINQIRIYSGEKYQTVDEVKAGEVCAVTGLEQTRPGKGIGMETETVMPLLEPVLTYSIQLPDTCDAAVMLPKLRMLEEEEPVLHIVWNEEHKEIQAKIMGEVQTEILKSLIKERFGVQVSFGSGHIVYKETIINCVEGVGHFEPLRHYAEVHLLLEPGERGSGLCFAADCSEDVLDKNWQRLVLTHLQERAHKGVLTGSAITDMKITLIGGKAHQKHTEGGDFRQATYRAVRQGLKEANTLLLEPYYDFQLEVPQTTIGRAMTDIERMCGTLDVPFTEGEMTVISGYAPVAAMHDYQKEVAAYTKGHGRLLCTLKGYEPCHNEEEVTAQLEYDSERDTENPTGSVFCAHGAGFVVSWDKVKEYMHVEARHVDSTRMDNEQGCNPKGGETQSQKWLGTDEVDAILERTFYANKRDKGIPERRIPKREIKAVTEGFYVNRNPKKQERKEEYLLVDGYNVIFAWEDLKELAEVNIDGARGKLMDILCNYQAIKGCNLILVFDAYRVQGHETEMLDYHNIHVVYTKEAVTADQYIERFAHENKHKYQVTVATSDGLEQIIIRGQGCGLLSARELREEVLETNQKICEEYADKQPTGRNYLFDSISEDIGEQIDSMRLT